MGEGRHAGIGKGEQSPRAALAKGTLQEKEPVVRLGPPARLYFQKLEEVGFNDIQAAETLEAVPAQVFDDVLDDGIFVGTAGARVGTLTRLAAHNGGDAEEAGVLAHGEHATDLRLVAHQGLMMMMMMMMLRPWTSGGRWWKLP